MLRWLRSSVSISVSVSVSVSVAVRFRFGPMCSSASVDVDWISGAGVLAAVAYVSASASISAFNSLFRLSARSAGAHVRVCVFVWVRTALWESLGIRCCGYCCCCCYCWLARWLALATTTATSITGTKNWELSWAERSSFPSSFSKKLLSGRLCVHLLLYQFSGPAALPASQLFPWPWTAVAPLRRRCLFSLTLAPALGPAAAGKHVLPSAVVGFFRSHSDSLECFF